MLGLTGYSPHHVMLVVSGSAGIVGMTQEHLALATALDVPFFITITKTDVTTPADTLLSLEAMLKSAGCRKVMQASKCEQLCHLLQVDLEKDIQVDSKGGPN